MAFAKLFSFDLYHALQNLGPFLRFKLCDTLIKLFRSISEILDGNNEVLQILLTLSPPNKLLSAKFLVCFDIQSASMWFKLGEKIV